MTEYESYILELEIEKEKNTEKIKFFKGKLEELEALEKEGEY